MINMPGLVKFAGMKQALQFFFLSKLFSLNLFIHVIDEAQYRILISSSNFVFGVTGFSCFQQNSIISTFLLFHKACFFTSGINRCALSNHKVYSLKAKIP